MKRVNWWHVCAPISMFLLWTACYFWFFLPYQWRTHEQMVAQLRQQNIQLRVARDEATQELRWAAAENNAYLKSFERMAQISLQCEIEDTALANKLAVP